MAKRDDLSSLDESTVPTKDRFSSSAVSSIDADQRWIRNQDQGQRVNLKRTGIGVGAYHVRNGQDIDQLLWLL